MVDISHSESDNYPSVVHKDFCSFPVSYIKWLFVAEKYRTQFDIISDMAVAFLAC